MSTEVFSTKLEAVLCALEDIDEGDKIVLCRQEEDKPCAIGGDCDMCAVIIYRKGMTPGDILSIARKHRA